MSLDVLSSGISVSLSSLNFKIFFSDAEGSESLWEKQRGCISPTVCQTSGGSGMWETQKQWDWFHLPNRESEQIKYTGESAALFSQLICVQVRRLKSRRAILW